MAHLYEHNGIIYLSNFDRQFSWVTYVDAGYDPYFILNNYTRALFKRDMLPLIKAEEVHISRDLFNKIRYHVNNPVNEIIPELEYLPGVTYKPHQETALNLMLKYNKFGFFLGPGSGKTIIALGFLKSVKPTSALIVTPQKVVAQYKQELEKFLGTNTNYEVTNYEQLHKYTDKQFECLILDESHKAKSYTSNTNKNCREIAKNCKYVYLFTGTPQDKSRHEILSQIAILDIRVMPIKTKVLNRYFNMDDYYNPSTEKAIFSNELTHIINSYTWGKKTDEVVQLTEEHFYIINCDKPMAYDRLAKDRVLRINIVGKQESVRCVADNKGVLKIKLRELCNGHIACEDSNKTPINIRLDTPKSDELATLITNTVNKGIIYYEFDNDLDYITEVLKACNKSYVVLNGKTSKKDIPILIENFKNNIKDFLVMQSKSGNAGLDLTNTNNIIFYSLPESYIVFTQCKARINRIGQTKECNYYYLICKDTIEEQMLSTLNRKKNFTTRLFKIYN